jgi:hypothetical protein
LKKKIPRQNVKEIKGNGFADSFSVLNRTAKFSIDIDIIVANIGPDNVLKIFKKLKLRNEIITG